MYIDLYSYKSKLFLPKFCLHVLPALYCASDLTRENPKKSLSEGTEVATTVKCLYAM